MTLLLAVLVLQPTVTVRHLERPDRVLPAQFTQVRGVIERPDGTVLIVDRLAEAVMIGDFATGRTSPIGRTGGGPAEYRLPGGLVPYPGDSTLVLDEGNNRLDLIGPDGRIHRTINPRTPETEVGLFPRAVDQAGRYYTAIPAWILFTQGIRPDSLPLVRYLPDARRLDRLAWLRPSPEPPPPPRRDRGRIPYIVFGAADAWAAGPDGRVAIVRARDYRVEWIDPTGVKTIGPLVSWTPVAVTAADRTSYTRQFLASSGTGGKGGGHRPPGGLEATPADMLTDKSVAEVVANTAFAATKPPFTDARPRIGPDGMLWVERSVADTAASLWDVFDRTGRLTFSLELRVGRRLAGIGRGTVYLVSVDPDGIETLERYRL